MYSTFCFIDPCAHSQCTVFGMYSKLDNVHLLVLVFSIKYPCMCGVPWFMCSFDHIMYLHLSSYSFLSSISISLGKLFHVKQ
jgi:hypothetical protein